MDYSVNDSYWVTTILIWTPILATNLWYKRNYEAKRRWIFGVETRHLAVYKGRSQLYIGYGRVGDTPERIVYTQMDISSTDWNEWICETPRELIIPQDNWEGADEQMEASIRGEIGKKVNQLRDPYVFQDDGQLYLFYTGGGEQAIGIVKLTRIKSGRG